MYKTTTKWKLVTKSESVSELVTDMINDLSEMVVMIMGGNRLDNNNSDDEIRAALETAGIKIDIRTRHYVSIVREILNANPGRQWKIIVNKNYQYGERKCHPPIKIGRTNGKHRQYDPVSRQIVGGYTYRAIWLVPD